MFCLFMHAKTASNFVTKGRDQDNILMAAYIFSFQYYSVDGILVKFRMKNFAIASVAFGHFTFAYGNSAKKRKKSNGKHQSAFN